MKLNTYPLGPIGTNCYFLEEDGKLCVIDPGDEPEKVLSLIETSSAELQYILLTHGHYDHTGAVKAVKNAYPNAKVMIHQEDAMGAGSQLFPLSGEVEGLEHLTEGQKLPFADDVISVLETPGHSRGSVCLQYKDHLFTGDTLFAGSMGRIDLPGGDYAVIMKSLHRLASLEGDFQVHPGHEASSTLEKERKTNPYLQMLKQ